jgi:uncharacterized protein
MTWPILYEFMRVTTHPRVMRRPSSAPHAWAFVAALLGSRGLGYWSRRSGTWMLPGK